MKQIILAIVCCISSTAFAQFKINGGSITVQNGAILTIDSLTFQPNADIIMGNTELLISNTPSTVNSGNTINKSYNFSNPFNFSGTVALQYADAALNGNAESGLQMIYSTTSSPVTWLTTTGSVVNTTTNTISQSYSNANIASISATSNTTPLALELIAFEAQKSINQENAIISWKIASVGDIQKFIVEKSSDAIDFKELGSVGINQKFNYELIDGQPFKGQNFYRLKIIENQEHISYSQVKLLNFGATKAEVSLFPNPTQTTFTIHTKDTALINTKADVFDLNGKIVAQFSIKNENTTVSAENWIPGMYIIRLQNGQVFKLEKK